MNSLLGLLQREERLVKSQHKQINERLMALAKEIYEVRGAIKVYFK